MFDNIRNDLTADKRVDPCVFCNRKPLFIQWEGRELVILGLRKNVLEIDSILHVEIVKIY